jgi:hypothetical protein
MPSPSSRQQVLLFGASNLTLGWNAVVSELVHRWQTPLNINVCLGMGRSWIGPSRVFWRILPGITECGLWHHLPEPSSRVAVMMTDIGNDIVYGYPSGKILDAVRVCLDRVLTWAPDCEIVMTRLPVPSIQTLTPIRFRIMRLILFPGSSRTLSSILSESEQVDRGVCDLAKEYSLRLIDSKAEWYGFDPIHVLKPKRAEVFCHYFSHWTREARNAADPGIPERLRSTRLPALPVTAERIVRGRQVLTPQPSFQSDLVTVSAW